jgi:hypothetical protein
MKITRLRASPRHGGSESAMRIIQILINIAAGLQDTGNIHKRSQNTSYHNGAGVNLRLMLP